jgi:hypothetical protein
MAVMDNRRDFTVRPFRDRIGPIARRISAAIALGLGACPIAHGRAPLPVIAETADMPTLAAVVKRIAPSVIQQSTLRLMQASGLALEQETQP